MLSKKRQILFEVLGHRTRASRSPERVPEEAPPRSRPTPRKRATQRSQSTARSESAPRSRSTALRQPAALWIGLAAVVLVSVSFVVYRIRRPGNPETPALQTNTSEARPLVGGEGEQPAAHVFAVCAFERTYKNKTEWKLADEKVREIVNFLGYHADPDFRDVRGKDHVGKEPNTGTYRIYVGSARSRSELVALKDKLTALSWKGSHPFQNASFMVIERAATPGSKEVSDER